MFNSSMIRAARLDSWRTRTLLLFALIALLTCSLLFANPSSANEAQYQARLGLKHVLWENMDCTAFGLGAGPYQDGTHPTVCDGWIPIWSYAATDNSQTGAWSKYYIKLNSVGFTDECGFTDEWSWITFDKRFDSYTPATEQILCPDGVTVRKYKTFDQDTLWYAVHDSYLIPRAKDAIALYK